MDRASYCSRSPSIRVDAGTSRFDSSLYWFYCKYSYMGCEDFNQLYGWEYTLLEPEGFWEKVPPKLTPIYHFYNASVSADYEANESTLRIISQVARPHDFVSFKLDIDTPSVEIPILKLLLTDKHLQSLVDEFVFEFNFRCEFLMFCGWGNEKPTEFAGLKLDRLHVMGYFQTLRYAGIRSHF